MFYLALNNKFKSAKLFSGKKKISDTSNYYDIRFI